jgi:response regulator of citrate/malate metabolism
MSGYLNNDITVAIVEDDPMVRRVTEGFLKKTEGYVCHGVYSSIKEAMEGIKRDPPQLILLDLFFPSRSGMDILKWTRKLELDIDVILITADHSSESVSLAMRYGAIDYLVKPFRFDRFSEALDKYSKVRKELVEKELKNQSKIDAVINRSNDEEVIKDDETSEEYDINKGKMHNPTYEKLLNFLAVHPDESFTAKMIGDKLGIARITARRYLDLMEYEGIIDLQLEYGGVGRPQNYYQFKGDKR